MLTWRDVWRLAAAFALGLALLVAVLIAAVFLLAPLGAYDAADRLENAATGGDSTAQEVLDHLKRLTPSQGDELCEILSEGEQARVCLPELDR